jgi:hypothetical protein
MEDSQDEVVDKSLFEIVEQNLLDVTEQLKKKQAILSETQKQLSQNLKKIAELEQTLSEERRIGQKTDAAFQNQLDQMHDTQKNMVAAMVAYDTACKSLFEWHTKGFRRKQGNRRGRKAPADIKPADIKRKLIEQLTDVHLEELALQYQKY